MHRPKQRFLEAVARKNTSREPKPEKKKGYGLYIYILWIKDTIDKESTVKIN